MPISLQALTPSSRRRALKPGSVHAFATMREPAAPPYDRGHPRRVCVLSACAVFLNSSDPGQFSNGIEQAIRELGLQRILLGRVLLPKILLTEPDDVILFEPAIPVKSFILGNEVLVCASSD